MAEISAIIISGNTSLFTKYTELTQNGIIEELEDIFWYKEHNAKMIDKSIILDYYAKYLLDYSKIKNNLDQIVTFYNYIYDINFKITLTLIKEGNYYETFNKRIKEVQFGKILIHNLI